MRFTRAILRPPPPGFADGITTADEGRPALALALAQHEAYCRALADCGLALTVLPPDPAHPDSCFVEDTAVLTARGALATRPGAPSRAGEVESILPSLQAAFGDVARMAGPGTLDGGDVCDADGHFLIGISARTNPQGARQLAQFLEERGHRASFIDIRSCAGLLHLKSGLSFLGDGRILAAPGLPADPALEAFERIATEPGDRYAANCVAINGRVLLAAGYPRVADALDRAGLDPLALDMSEFRKMDGGLSCLSLRF